MPAIVKLVPPTPNSNGREEPFSHTARDGPVGESSAGAAGPSMAKRRATEFPPERPIRSLRAVYYVFNRFLLGGAPLGRAITVLFLALAGLWATGLLPGRWTVSAFWLAMLAVHLALAASMRRNDFVAFEASQNMEPAAGTFVAEDKAPVHVTGLLSVEGKYRRFTFLPGYYRTFATREHAILALVRKRSLWGLAAVPEDEPGMWYAFVSPDQIRSVTAGKIRFDGEVLDAIAVAYTVTIPAKNRFQRSKTTTETLHIAPCVAQDVARICSDLILDAPPQAAAVPQTIVAAHTRK